MKRVAMKSPEARIYHQELIAKVETTNRSHLKMLKDLLDLHAPGGFGLCKVCAEVRAHGSIRSSYPCRTVRTIERRLK